VNTYPSPEELLLQREQEVVAVQLIEELPGPDKIIIYGYANGYTMDEIGRLIGRSPDKVASRLGRVARNLAQRLGRPL
jgi:DNA-directed RNA polymerase specialized sigma24 family protein